MDSSDRAARERVRVGRRSVAGRIKDRVSWLTGGKSGVAAATQTILAQSLIVVLNLATGMLSARALLPQGRGELAAINLVPQVMTPLVALGLPSALIYHLKRHPTDTARTIGAGMILNALIAVLAIVIGELFVPSMLHRYSQHVVTITRFFVLTVPLALLFSMCGAIFEAFNRFNYSNAARIGSPLITVTSLVTFALFHKLNVLTAAISYGLPSLPISLMMLRALFTLRRPVFTLDLEPYRRLLSFGLRSYAVEVLRTLGTQIDQILVVGFLTPAKMGLYVVALSAAWVLQVVQSSVTRVLLPRVAARPLPEIIEAVGRAARVTIAITFVLSLILILFGPVVLHVLYGPRFVEAYQLLRVLAVEAFLSTITVTLAQAFAATGRPGTLALFQIAGLMVGIPLLVLFIPRFGLVGAGLALLCATTLRLAFIFICFPMLMGVAPPRLLLTKADVVEFIRRLRATETAPT